MKQIRYRCLLAQAPLLFYRLTEGTYGSLSLYWKEMFAYDHEGD